MGLFHSRNEKYKNKKGFTLVELMLVIAILGILITSLFFVVTGHRERARDTNRILAIGKIGESIEISLADGNRVPGFNNLVTHNKGISVSDTSEMHFGEDEELKRVASNVHWRKGKFNQDVLEESATLKTLFTDPKTRDEYDYYVSEDGAYYYIQARKEVEIDNDKRKFFATNLTTSSSINNSNSNGGGSNDSYSSGGSATPPPPPPPPSSIPDSPVTSNNNCSAGTKEGYNYESLIHGSTQSVSKTENNTPTNGRTNYTAIARCDNGEVSFADIHTSIECDTSFHEERGSCISNTKSCTVNNGSGRQVWNGSSWGSCETTSCNSNFHKEGNACVSNTKSCTIENGSGRQVWNGSSWGSCEVASCNTGYTKDAITNTCEVACENPIYLDTNGVTIKARECTVAGREYEFNGERYYVARDTQDLLYRLSLNSGAGEEVKRYPANKIVTSKLTALYNLGWRLRDNKQLGGGDPASWDTSNVTHMEGLFEHEDFYGNLKHWNTSNVVSMANMFKNAYSSTPQDLSLWNTSKVANMSGMFYFAQNTSIKGLENWDTSSVTNMSKMFAYSSVGTYGINNWNVSSVRDMSEMFVGRYFSPPAGINQWNVSNVKHMNGMFYGVDNFDVDLSGWCVQYINSMPYEFIDSVSPMSLPENAHKLPKWGTCPQEEPIYLDNNGVTMKARDFSVGGQEYTYKGVRYYVARDKNDLITKLVDGYPTERIITTKVTDMSYMIQEVGDRIGAGSGEDFKLQFNEPLNNWDVSNVTNMSHMFHDAHNFNQPLNNWDVGNVRDMSYIFWNIAGFQQGSSLNNWNIRNVTNFTYAFNLCFSHPDENIWASKNSRAGNGAMFGSYEACFH